MFVVRNPNGKRFFEIYLFNYKAQFCKSRKFTIKMAHKNV